MKTKLFIFFIFQTFISYSQIEQKIITDKVNSIINTIQKDDITLFRNQFPSPDSLLIYKSKQDFFYQEAYEKLKSDSLKLNEYRNINKQFYISKFIQYRYVEPLTHNWKNIKIIEIQKIKSIIEAGKQIEKAYIILNNIISNEVFILSVELDFLLYKNNFLDFTITEIHNGFSSLKDLLSFQKLQNKTIERATDNPLSKTNGNEEIDWKVIKQIFISNNPDNIIAEFKYLKHKDYNKLQTIKLKLKNEEFNFNKRESLLRSIYVINKNNISSFSKEILLYSDIEKETENIWILLEQENFIDGYLFDKDFNLISKTELTKIRL